MLKGTLDFETDPFKRGRVPQPFASCIYFDDVQNTVIWSSQCAELTYKALLELPRCELYAHNGGKFDFWYLLPFISPQDVQIINGRIATMTVGECTLIDSYLLIAEPLANFKKDRISYKKMEKKSRLKYRAEIIKYMVADCRYLLELVNGFHTILGKKLTIGAAAMKSMKDRDIEIEKQNVLHDAVFRPFFHGGRVQCFEPGRHEFNKATARVIDINSAYSHAMLSYHPHGALYKESTKIPKPKYKNGSHINGWYFVEIDAVSHGALPVQLKTGELAFPDDDEVRTFCVTGWEIEAGLSTGTLEIMHVHRVLIPKKKIEFRAFVRHHYDGRKAAKAAGDKLLDLIHKKCGNSGYGKFATDPNKFYDWCIAEIGDDVTRYAGGEGFSWYNDVQSKSLWRKPSCEEAKAAGYYDVATAASITGYVRAKLWRGLCAIERPLYCDTDSIFFAGYSDIVPSSELGDWKTEMEIREAHLLGKKLYALRGTKDGKRIRKFASKGARLRYADIVALWRNGAKTWRNPAPTFSLFRGIHFLERELTFKSAIAKSME